MKRKRELTGEERDVWFAVTRGVRPYHATPVAPPAKRKTGVSHSQIELARSSPRPAKSSAVRRPHAAEAGDPRLDRRAARGRLPIDATLDLHGYYQAGAHAALRAFIADANARRHRCVLVITGKGVQSSGSGVLRRRFLEWVEEQDLRQSIARIAQAHPRHGGAGAFYVFLKSSRRTVSPKINR